MPHQCCTMLQDPLKPINKRQKPQKEQAIRIFDSHNKDCKKIDSKIKHQPRTRRVIHGVEAREKIHLRRGEKVKICLSKLRSLGLPWDLQSPIGVEWIGSIGKGGTLMTLRNQ